LLLQLSIQMLTEDEYFLGWLNILYLTDLDLFNDASAATQDLWHWILGLSVDSE